MLLKSFGRTRTWVSPDVLPLTSAEVALRPPCSCFAGGIVTIAPQAPGTGLSSLTGPFRVPCLHRPPLMGPPTNNGIHLQYTAWGLTTPHPPQEICVHKRSLPLQRSPLCPEVFCWFKEQMWCRQQQCQLPPASPSTHLEGAAEQEEEVVQPYCFFHSSAFLAELASEKYQLLPLVAMALMMGRAVSWEVDWHNQFISHRSANSHQIKMIFVRYRPGFDWNQWPGDERLRKKGFYFVYGHTSLLSPPHSFSCPKLFLFFFFSPPQKL